MKQVKEYSGVFQIQIPELDELKKGSEKAKHMKTSAKTDALNTLTDILHELPLNGKYPEH